ncbi:Imm50 family immunity protein [Rahnella woolbedingensis]|uniref:Immunity protein 50 n=1 Tax=Rahnella woolbedingensis TaxID=1510574 RepID=A0A419NDI5_9GAMM|nr:Imm50 family immunity protein [Rahnella woolbedingensis]RJT46685.1 hypothetical protein D6C13_02520 [Rahnella woolbedingensis]
MKLWTDYLVDSQHIDSIYHDDKPSLNNVDIHEIIFHRDGPKISIRMNLNEYPSSPPKKWVLQKFNTVQLTLTLIDIKDVNMSGWINTNYVADASIEIINDNIFMKLDSVSLKFIAKAKFMDVESIVSYMKK